MSVDWICEPNSSTASGISATEGIGRKNSIVEWVSVRSTCELPMAMPITTPAITDMTSPIAQASSVSPSAVQNSALCSSLNSATMMVLNGGR